MHHLMKGFKKIVTLNFPTSASGRPWICDLARRFDLEFNILQAHITPRHEGVMTLEIMGLEENYKQGVAYLREQGIDVSPAAQRVFRDEDACVHCGMCTALCSTGAMWVDPESRMVVFDKERCSACGLCVRICPVRAMDVDVEEGALT
ncbi:NIL domain-containing protein [Desulfohalovibrio reitneri]|uniref:NIL domain-containing protein n=1 Tax=Desulfohalovibrio reitneri TaxID=1307759 RepID=UPI0004A71FAD|nr:NIL domain-containing protein [Desulfohalovibrio reitneri]